jgi:hypothetical protein
MEICVSGNMLGTVDGICITCSDELRDEIGQLARRSRTALSMIVDSILDEVGARLEWIRSETEDQFLVIIDDRRLRLRATLLTPHSIYVTHAPQGGGS